MSKKPLDQTDHTNSEAHLGLWDAVSIIVGIVVGTAIFKTPQFVFFNVSGPWLGMGCWLLGGVLVLIGALCYAELATTYPRMGGDYVYLTRAYGSWAGFLFGWAQLTVILTGSIGSMAFAFADYAVPFAQLDQATCTYTYTLSSPSGRRLAVETTLPSAESPSTGSPSAGSDDDTNDASPLEFLGGDSDNDGLLGGDEQWEYRAQLPLANARGFPTPDGLFQVKWADTDETVFPLANAEKEKVGDAGSPELLLAFSDDVDAAEATVASWTVWLAIISVVVLTALNLIGIVFGKTVQNLLSVVKILGLVGIVILGMVWGGDGALTVTKPMTGAGFGLAMVFVLYAYGGWNDAAFIAAEVRNRKRNIPLALLLGTSGITVIYLLVNAAYLWGLGFEGLRSSMAPAADLAAQVMGPRGSKMISLLVMISALGAINGLIFTGSRIYVSMGADHRIFAWLGRWDSRRSVPVRSLLTQTAVTLGLILTVGTTPGRDFVDSALGWIGLDPLPWAQYYGGFNTLVAATAPTFWGFFLLTGLSLFVLRAKDRDIQRPFSAPLYPLEPILFCGTCIFMLYSAVDYAKGLSLLGLAPLVVGAALYLLNRSLGASGQKQTPKGVGQ